MNAECEHDFQASAPDEVRCSKCSLTVSTAEPTEEPPAAEEGEGVPVPAPAEEPAE